MLAEWDNGSQSLCENAKMRKEFRRMRQRRRLIHKATRCSIWSSHCDDKGSAEPPPLTAVRNGVRCAHRMTKSNATAFGRGRECEREDDCGCAPRHYPDVWQRAVIRLAGYVLSRGSALRQDTSQAELQVICASFQYCAEYAG